MITSKSRLRFLLLRDLAVAGVLQLPMAVHDFYHFTDWMVWGFGYHGLDPVRAVLYPIFEQSMSGYVNHVVVLILSWVGIVFLGGRMIHYVRLLDRALSRLLHG